MISPELDLIELMKLYFRHCVKPSPTLPPEVMIVVYNRNKMSVILVTCIYDSSIFSQGEMEDLEISRTDFVRHSRLQLNCKIGRG